MKKILIIGHSHINALKKAWDFFGKEFDGVLFHFLSLNDKNFSIAKKSLDVYSVGDGDYKNKRNVVDEIKRVDPDSIVMLTDGNQHNVSGFLRDVNHELKLKRLVSRVYSNLVDWNNFIKSSGFFVSFVIPPPPPFGDQGKIIEFLSGSKSIENPKIEQPQFRVKLWREQLKITRKFSTDNGLGFIELPEDVFSDDGFLSEKFYGNDVTHANHIYGNLILKKLLEEVKGEQMNEKNISKRCHPYVTLPEHCFWKQSIGAVPMAEVDPVVQTRFKIQPKHRVATAGSCFAQHISKRLRNSGFKFFVTEKSDETDTENQARGFYDFSARYGNIYTSRQLLQLFDRAFGYYKPNEQFWSRHGGGYCDPFRPLIEPEGFESPEAVLQDSRRHLASVRRMFKHLDVFVFTLGLTECWMSRLDGATYPLAPGVAGGSYDSEKHVFVNLGVSEVVTDLKLFLQKLKLVNPSARMILTVSPVPLMATAERDTHVLAATTYSKSVLRVAAQEIVNSHENVYYFPSYEIITGQHVGNGYYAEDRRSVVEQGVDHVMRIFMSHLTENAQKKVHESSARVLLGNDNATVSAEVERLVQVACDEEMLAK